MRGRQSAVPQVRIGQPQSVGDLDKAIIRRYIKRNIQKITYCYEKQLLARPGLEGTVSTQFFISPNGTVAASNASGVDGEVASCVAAVIKNIEFPKPKGGGGVQVNYPFNFRPTGG
jgi:outer membrane biosynthesis protein TonB